MLHHTNRALRWDQNGLSLHNRLPVGCQITYHTVVLSGDSIGAFVALIRFYQAVFFLPLLLFQDYHIPACNTKYSFLLHCGDNYCAESLRGHGGLDDVGVAPAGFVQDSEVVVYPVVGDVRAEHA